MENLEENILQKYSFKYNVTTGVEPVIRYNNTTLTKNSSVPLNGEDIYITFPKTGVYNIKVLMENQYGYVLEKDFSFDVNYANFDVKVSNLPSKTFINNEYSFNVEPVFLKEETSKVDYTFKVKASPNTKVYYDDRLLNNDVFTSYSSSKIKVVFAKEESTDIEFTFKNNQGLEVSKKQSFDARIADFDLDVIKADKYLPNKRTPLKFKLSDKSGLSNLDYTFNVVTNSPSAKFYYNGSLISKDVNNKYSNGELEVIFDKEGTYEVTVTAKNSHGKTVSKKVVLQVDPVKFNFSITSTGKIYPKEKKSFAFKISKEDKEEQNYTFSYLVKNGGKPSVSYNGYLVGENQSVEYKTEDLGITFPEVGLYEIEYIVKNQFGSVVKQNVTYDVNYANFDLDVTNLPSNIFLNTKYPVNVIAKSVGEDISKQKYSMKIEANSSVKAYYKGYQISLNNYVDYSESKVELDFSSTGQQEVVFYLRNSQGKEVSKKVVFTSKTATFELDVKKDKQYLSYSKGKLAVKPVDNSGLSNLSYKFSVTYPSDLKVSYNGSQIASGMTLNYVGSSFDIDTAKDGDYELNFSFENNQGHKLTQKVVLQVDAVKFNYAVQVEGKIYPDVTKSFKIVPAVEGSIDQKFKFKYISKGNRPLITSQGNTIYENEYVNFNSQNLEILFKETGGHDIELFLQNQYGYTVPKTIKFNVGTTKFDIETENLPKDVYINKEFEIGVAPKAEENIPNINYEIRVTGADVVTYNNYPIPNNTYVRYNAQKLGLKFTKTGAQEATISLKNSQGLEVHKKLIFDVKTANTTLEFTLPEKIYPLKETAIKATLKGANIEGIKHKFKLKSSDSSVIVKYNNSELSYNNMYDYAGDEFKMTFPRAGRYTLNFDIENNLGGTTSKPLVVEVLDTSYEVRIVQPTQIFPNIGADFKVNVIETLTSKYKFKYNVQGGYGGLTEVNYAGKRIYPDEWLDYKTADFKLTFPSEGNFVFTLDFQNEFGKEVRQRFEIKVAQPNFTIDVVHDNNNIIKNEEFPVRLVLKKTPANQNVTFTIKGDNSINYVKYQDRKIYLGEELNLTTEGLVFNIKEEGQHTVTFEFKNEFGFKQTRAVKFNVNAKDYKTTITSKILSTPITGYDAIWYENPVKVGIDINSLLQAKDLKIRFRNSSLIDADGTFYPNVFYQLSKLNNTFTFNFDRSIFGNANNVLIVDVQDTEGKVTQHNITLPINIKADKPYIEDINEKTFFYKRGVNNDTFGFTTLYYGINEGRPILVTTPVGIKSVRIETYMSEHKDLTTYTENITSITKKDNNTYEIFYNRKGVEMYNWKDKKETI